MSAKQIGCGRCHGSANYSGNFVHVPWCPELDRLREIQAQEEKLTYDHLTIRHRELVRASNRSLELMGITDKQFWNQWRERNG